MDTVNPVLSQLEVMKLAEKRELIEHLTQFVTEARWEKMQRVLNQRTRQITVMLEDIYQPHNASAVLRSCDCFGVQDVHVVENHNEFSPNKGVSLGSDQWLTLYRYNDEGVRNTQQCLQRLREQGYALVATTPHTDLTLDQLPVDRKLAFLFGTELKGLSQEAIEQADLTIRIPMMGFTESFNISVSAALCLYDVTHRLRKSRQDWGLSEAEKMELQLAWLRRSAKASAFLEKQFLSQHDYGNGWKSEAN